MKIYAVLFLLLTPVAYGQTGGEHWVTTWTTPQPLIRNPPRPPALQPPPAPPGQSATGTTPATPSAPPPSAGAPAPQPGQPAPAGPNLVQQAINAQGFHNQTVRMIVHTTIPGSKLRVKLSSPFGYASMVVGSAHVAIRDKDSEIVSASDHTLSFNGKPGCTVGPGMVILSDPVDMAVAGEADVAVSLYFPGETGPPSSHNGLHTTYISKEGDSTGSAAISDPLTTQAYYWLESVDVLAPGKAAAAVALGDSITEGFRSTPDTNHTWPDVLAARLAADHKTANVAVANMGIGGNRVLHDGVGASALARFDRDVLSQAGVKWVIILEGINDIGHGDVDPVSADELIGGYKQIIERAHTHGLKVLGCTLPPYQGANYFREDGETIREALNAWIRSSGAFDAVADFEAATRDPNNLKRIRPDFDPGDHLHLNDAGYRAMAEAIDLSLFR